MKTYVTTDASDLEIQNLRSRQANLFERQKKHQESIDCLLSRAEAFQKAILRCITDQPWFALKNCVARWAILFQTGSGAQRGR